MSNEKNIEDFSKRIKSLERQNKSLHKKLLLADKISNENSLLSQKFLEEKKKAEMLYEELKYTKFHLAESEKVAAMTKVFEKFVPRQFLDRIVDKEISEIEFGKGGLEHVTILFSDIRSFTTMSENMSPQELLNFINKYLERINPVIHKHHGFIDKFIGDAIMALFVSPNQTINQQAENGLKAAIAMQMSVQTYNQEREDSGLTPIRIGVGLHTGEVIMGTIGTSVRMDSTVLGDNVNLSSRLEDLSKNYGVDIIISETTLSLLKNIDQIDYRELDWLVVKGKSQPLMIYEIFSHLPRPIRKVKKKVGKLIKTGLFFRKTQQWDEALAYFQKAYDLSPEDKTVTHHIEYCLYLKENPPDSDWNGAIDITIDPTQGRVNFRKKIEWNSNLLTGIELIDTQHQELFNRINRLVDAIDQGQEQKEVLDTIQFLESYILTHFQDEQELMKREEYPQFTAHRDAHDEYIRIVKNIREEYKSHGITLNLAFKIQSRIIDWLIQHVTTVDVSLSQWIQSKQRS